MMLRRRTDPKTGTRTLCEPAQSKCTWAFHKSHDVREFTRKMPQTKTGDHTLCEPAQSKWHFTTTILCGNLQVKCHRPAGTPWSSTGLYTPCKNPSVWTHCLGKKDQSAAPTFFLAKVHEACLAKLILQLFSLLHLLLRMDRRGWLTLHCMFHYLDWMECVRY